MIFVQYLTILFGCTDVRWLEATCPDSSRQSRGFRQRDLATSRVAQISYYSQRETPRVVAAALLVRSLSHPGGRRGWWWVSFEYSASIPSIVARRCTAAAKDALALRQRGGRGFVTATCHLHAACACSPFGLWPPAGLSLLVKLFCWHVHATVATG